MRSRNLNSTKHKIAGDLITDCSEHTNPDMVGLISEVDASTISKNLLVSSRQARKARQRKRNPLLATDLDISDDSTEEATGDEMRIIPALRQASKPLLIVSIGNPGSTYASTYHSAGHVIASFLQQRSSELPSTWSIRQSKAYMNVSGPEVSKIYKKDGMGRKLVVLYDDMEREFGNVRTPSSSNSAQGHNGILSLKQSLAGKEWYRVAIGIGRPDSRDPTAASNFVLSKMGSEEVGILKDSTTDKVIAALDKIGST